MVHSNRFISALLAFSYDMLPWGMNKKNTLSDTRMIIISVQKLNVPNLLWSQLPPPPILSPKSRPGVQNLLSCLKT